MKKLAAVLIIGLFAFSAMAWGQMADRAELKNVTEKYNKGLAKQPGFSLLDPSRLNLSHSYSLSFFSGGGVSGSLGLYNGTLTYQLAKPLTLSLNLGILHDPGALYDRNRGLKTSTTFLPSGRLDWNPSNNFRMSVSFQTYPAVDYFNSSYGFGRYQHWPN